MDKIKKHMSIQDLELVTLIMTAIFKFALKEPLRQISVIRFKYFRVETLEVS